MAEKVHAGRNRVSSCPRDLAHDRHSPFGHQVYQGAFACVGRSDDGDFEPLANRFSHLTLVQVALNLLSQLPHLLSQLDQHLRRDIAGLVCLKIDVGLNVSEHLEQLRPQLIVDVALPALELHYRKFALRLAFRIDQVMEAFSLQQVQLAVKHGASRELSLHAIQEQTLGEPASDTNKPGVMTTTMEEVHLRARPL